MTEYSDYDRAQAIQWVNGFSVMMSESRARRILASELRLKDSIIHEARVMAEIMRAELESLRHADI